MLSVASDFKDRYRSGTVSIIYQKANKHISQNVELLLYMSLVRWWYWTYHMAVIRQETNIYFAHLRLILIDVNTWEESICERIHRFSLLESLSTKPTKQLIMMLQSRRKFSLKWLHVSVINGSLWNALISCSSNNCLTWIIISMWHRTRCRVSGAAD